MPNEVRSVQYLGHQILRANSGIAGAEVSGTAGPASAGRVIMSESAAGVNSIERHPSVQALNSPIRFDRILQFHQ